MPRKSTKVDRTCGVCGTPFRSKPCDIKRGAGKYCSIVCGLKARTRPLAERFREFIGEPTEYGCLLWTGHLDHRGYGAIGGGPEVNGTVLRANRVAWELAYGSIPEGMYVCHSCDKFYAPGDATYRRCVRPEHLFLGTQADNMADMVSKQRQSRGEGHAKARLTDEIVISMRERFHAGKVTLVQLSDETGLRADYLSKVVNGSYWKHLPINPPVAD